jgi:hypothetical protein
MLRGVAHFQIHEGRAASPREPQSLGEDVPLPPISLPTEKKEFLFWIFIGEILVVPVPLPPPNSAALPP